MSKQGDGTQEWLAQNYLMSKGTVSNKIRGYTLMQNTYIPLMRDTKKEIQDLSTQWSWFGGSLSGGESPAFSPVSLKSASSVVESRVLLEAATRRD
jgi:hypothetical protein